MYDEARGAGAIGGKVTGAGRRRLHALLLPTTAPKHRVADAMLAMGATVEEFAIRAGGPAHVASGLNEEQISQLAAERIRASLAVKEGLLAPEPLAAITAAAALDGRRTPRDGGKLLVFGNGGSAADAEHIAAEFVGRFLRRARGAAGASR